MRHDITRQFEQVSNPCVENCPSIFDRNANAVERALGGPQGAHLSEIVEDRRMHGLLRKFLPVVIVLGEKLEVAINQTKMRELAEVERDESLVREQVVDERKNIEGEIHAQLPGVLKGHRLLISEHVIAHGKARHVRAVKRLHQVFVWSDFRSELALVFSKDCVCD